MFVRLNSKNQITIPKTILSAYQGAKYFDVADENGYIVLIPVCLDRADAARSKLADLGITKKDVADALSWARSNSKKT